MHCGIWLLHQIHSNSSLWCQLFYVLLLRQTIITDRIFCMLCPWPILSMHSAGLHYPLLWNAFFSFQLKLGSNQSPLRRLNNCALASVLWWTTWWGLRMTSACWNWGMWLHSLQLFCLYTVLHGEQTQKRSRTAHYSRLCTSRMMWQGSDPRHTHTVLLDHLKGWHRYNCCTLFLMDFVTT